MAQSLRTGLTRPRGAQRGDTHIQRGRPDPAHRHFGSATTRARTSDAPAAVTSLFCTATLTDFYAPSGFRTTKQVVMHREPNA
jgi:hypothetical protein